MLVFRGAGVWEGRWEGEEDKEQLKVVFQITAFYMERIDMGDNFSGLRDPLRQLLLHLKGVNLPWQDLTFLVSLQRDASGVGPQTRCRSPLAVPLPCASQLHGL